MTQQDLLSINTVAAKLGLSVHQLRRWELMFGLEIKRGRGQQRQYRPEDLSILERIKELVEQGWPTSQIRPQLEAEGLITPKLIGVPQQPGNPEMLMEAIIGLRSFAERRFIEISKQIDELRQLMISITLRNELRNEISSPWQPVEEEFAPPAPDLPAQEISIGPAVNVAMPESPEFASGAPQAPPERKSPLMPPPVPVPTPPETLFESESSYESVLEAEPFVISKAGHAEPPVQIAEDLASEQEPELAMAPPEPPAPLELPAPPDPPAPPAPPAPPPVPPRASEPRRPAFGLGEITDQNYLTVLGKALDMIGWTDEQADQYSQDSFGVPHWDELGRSQAEKLIAYLVEQMSSGSDPATV